VSAQVRPLFEEEVDLIAALALFQAILAQLSPHHFDVDPDFVTVSAGMQFNVGIPGFEGKRGLATDRKAPGPGVVSVLCEAGQRRKNGEDGQCRDKFRLHGSVYGADPQKVPGDFGYYGVVVK
jgi:hypothetical protein